jgi:hypothetical protein
MEKYVKDSFINAGTSVDKLQKIYKEFMSDMNEEFIAKVKGECIGYGMNIGEAQSKATTINEILHYLHSYIVNNENVLSSVPQIGTKKNDFNYPINYRGIENDNFNQLFNSFPCTLDVGFTEMVSLNDNKMVMMVRDRGHALTIEITLKGDIARMEYFIPKLCNIDMINELPGINKVTIDSVGATGIFEVDKDELKNRLFDFISKVPTDADMRIIRSSVQTM